jgi:hypothetical protein
LIAAAVIASAASREFVRRFGGDAPQMLTARLPSFD